MQMVVADANEYVDFGLGKLLAHHGDAFFDFRGARRLLQLLEEARHEWIVGDADDRNDLGHGLPPVSRLMVSSMADLVV
jgi:hypothetical protein